MLNGHMGADPALDACLHCHVCVAVCPVAAVTDRFAGPRTAGPLRARFGLDPADIPGVDLCSGCGLCSVACPHGVPVANLTRAPGHDAGGQSSHRRSGPLAPVVNWWQRRSLQSRHGQAPSVSPPARVRESFEVGYARWQREQGSAPLIGRRKVVLLLSDDDNRYFPSAPHAAVQVLAHHACKLVAVTAPARDDPARLNLLFDTLAGYQREHYVVVTLDPALQNDLIAAVHTLGHPAAESLAPQIRDFFDLLLDFARSDELNRRVRLPLPPALYFVPCHRQTVQAGLPALDVLRTLAVPVTLSSITCCGVVNDYGYAPATHKIAWQIGEPLFAEVAATDAPAIICDSGACRHWIQAWTGRPLQHPVELLAELYGLLR